MRKFKISFQIYLIPTIKITHDPILHGYRSIEFMWLNYGVEIKFNKYKKPPYISDDFQIGPEGAYENNEEWVLYMEYTRKFVGHDDVPSHDWFINELQTNEKFRKKYGN